MKYKITALILAFIMLAMPAAGCAQTQDSGKTVLLATSYPVYIFASNITKGTDVFDIQLMVDQQISCIHDYTLSVKDMLKLENADILIKSGAGLEEFLDDALGAYPDLESIDCSDGVPLLYNGEGEIDPHIWLDPENAETMCRNICDGLSREYPDYSDIFAENTDEYCDRLTALNKEIENKLSNLSCRSLVTFHDGFTYFAEAYDLDIAYSIEEESGSEASAKEICEIVDIIKAKNIPAVFTEINGSSATAETISRETGAAVGVLTTITSGEKTLTGYEDLMRSNAEAVASLLK